MSRTRPIDPLDLYPYKSYHLACNDYDFRKLLSAYNVIFSKSPTSLRDEPLDIPREEYQKYLSLISSLTIRLRTPMDSQQYTIAPKLDEAQEWGKDPTFLLKNSHTSDFTPISLQDFNANHLKYRVGTSSKKEMVCVFDLESPTIEALKSAPELFDLFDEFNDFIKEELKHAILEEPRVLSLAREQSRLGSEERNRRPDRPLLDTRRSSSESSSDKQGVPTLIAPVASGVGPAASNAPSMRSPVRGKREDVRQSPEAEGYDSDKNFISSPQLRGRVTTTSSPKTPKTPKYQTMFSKTEPSTSPQKAKQKKAPPSRRPPTPEEEYSYYTDDDSGLKGVIKRAKAAISPKPAETPKEHSKNKKSKK